MHGRIRSHWSAKSMSILTGCIHVSDLLYLMIEILYHTYIIYVYLYTSIIVFFFRRQAKASYLLRTLTFSRSCKYRNLLQHCSEDCAVHQPKESKQRIQPQHVPSTSATTYHQPPKKMAVTKVETLNWRAFALWDPIPSKQQISCEMVWVWYHQTSSR